MGLGLIGGVQEGLMNRIFDRLAACCFGVAVKRVDDC